MNHFHRRLKIAQYRQEINSLISGAKKIEEQINQLRKQQGIMLGNLKLKAAQLDEMLNEDEIEMLDKVNF